MSAVISSIYYVFQGIQVVLYKREGEENISWSVEMLKFDMQIFIKGKPKNNCTSAKTLRFNGYEF